MARRLSSLFLSGKTSSTWRAIQGVSQPAQVDFQAYFHGFHGSFDPMTALWVNCIYILFLWSRLMENNGEIGYFHNQYQLLLLAIGLEH
ncbi:hypothetical protein Prudu_014189 [Prunus dulcis]|uniref:Uncharacterized protein n=1 Tax=Prunus dulcis TaxID=3755 RepID=A0A4Y1RGG5_PRUDU|nr:hypothetical protein Prudu_014189 [Prunus dulcis]